jgi:hypothetical protein
MGRPAPDAVGTSGDGRRGAAQTAALEEPRADVLQAICKSQFGQGDLAEVEVYRNASRAVTVLALRPDLTRFTHAPHTYYGPDGTSLLVVPDRPVTQEERKSDPVLRKQDELLRSLTKSASTSCSKHR